jgi:hypothetical protein
MKARVLSDGSPVAGAPVDFKVRHVASGETWTYTSKSTGSDGYAITTWTISFLRPSGGALPCSSIELWARHATLGVESSKVSGKVAYPTSITISAPSSVLINEEFTISGVLKYQKTSTEWAGLAGKTVSIYRDATKITDVTTGSDGSYSCKTSISSPGSYTLKASYAGEGLGLVFAVAGLEVGVPPEIEPLVQCALYALATVPVVAVGGIVAYNELAKGR